MIELFMFQKAWQIIDINPFCMAVDSFLKITQLPYQTTYLASGQNTPNGTLPYIKDGHHELDDSREIMRYLINKHQLAIDKTLNKHDVIQADKLMLKLEKHLYPVMLYSRLIDKKGLAIFNRDIFKPQGMNEDDIEKMITGLKQGLLKTVRHKESDQVYQQGIAVLAEIKNQMSHKDYIFGHKPCSYDASLYAFLMNIYHIPVDSPLSLYHRTYFLEYCARCTRGLAL